MYCSQKLGKDFAKFVAFSEYMNFKPKFDNWFFVDLSVLYELWKWNCFCIAELAEQFQVRILYKIHNLGSVSFIEVSESDSKFEKMTL